LTKNTNTTSTSDTNLLYETLCLTSQVLISSDILSEEEFPPTINDQDILYQSFESGETAIVSK